MKTLFINEVRIDFYDINQSINTEKYKTIFKQPIGNYKDKLEESVLFVNPSIELVNDLKQLVLAEEEIADLERISILVNHPIQFFEAFIIDFKLIEAAGGIVKQKEKVLLIKRLGVWDFPKGKIEKGEKKKVAAIREVEEECGVKAKLGELITETFHVYPNRKPKKYQYALKKTYWYEMTCLDDAKMKPQQEEDIEEVVWMTKREARIAMNNSYKSLKYLYQIYYS